MEAQLPCRFHGCHPLRVDPTEQVNEFLPRCRSATGTGCLVQALLDPERRSCWDGEIRSALPAAGVGRGLAVTVRAEEPQIGWPIVEEVTVDVIDMQDE
ncbi:hypothetical protein [Micromonospora sp. 067-2]|uniref:hypothetical protein n=1 Tax=Micromonospora sp. 067-2 TaxID=2789270 RepID=UPI003977EF80